MQTRDARAIRRMHEHSDTADVQAEAADTLAALCPTLDRLRRGEWRLLVTGPRCERERDEAAMLSARLLDLADVLGAGGISSGRLG